MLSKKLKIKQCLFLLLITSACWLQCAKENILQPVAVKGVLDLAGWDFDRDGVVHCNGKWKFRWMDTAPEFASPAYDDSNWDLAEGSTLIDKPKPTYGYGWYRLHVKNFTGEHLGLYMKETRDAYSVYINGSLVFSNGLPGTSRATSVFSRKKNLIYLPHVNAYTLAINVSNYTMYGFGFRESPVLGSIKELNNLINRADMANAFITGIILIMFLYHLILWMGRRKDRAALWFALFCLIIACRVIFIGAYLERWFSHIKNIAEIESRLRQLINPLGMITFIRFTSFLFPAEMKNSIIKLVIIVNLAEIAFMLITPVSGIISFYVFVLLILVFSMTLYTINLFIALKNKRSVSLLMCIGALFLLCAVINDCITTIFTSYTLELVPIGFIIFLFFQSTILSIRFTRAFCRAEYLTVNLQEEAALKTKEIDKQNKELIKVNEERTNFFINFAHETRTPVTNIYNYLEHYLKHNPGDEDLLIVQKNVHKLKRDIQNYLDIERLLHGRIIYNHNRVIDASGIVKEISSAFQQTAVLQGITISTLCEDNLVLAVDPAAFDRILNNLLDNAIRYNKRGGAIMLTLSKQDAYAVISIRDTGIGIEAGKLPHIFAPFYQINREKGSLHGIGMGLNIVKKILDDLHVKIQVDSVLGEGTTFTLYFPLAAVQTAESAGAKPETVSSPERAAVPVYHEAALLPEVCRDDRYTLLIVEDKRETLVFLQRALIQKYNVYYAENGRAALEKITHILKPHLIISDIMMDEMDGYAFYQAIKAHEAFNDIPFIFLTARDTMQDKLCGLNLGAVDYICKPFEPDALIARIQSLLAFIEKKTEKERNSILARVRYTFADMEKQADEESAAVISGLSTREKEILALMLKGYHNKEISVLLKISARTIDKHNEHIYKKCNVKSRAELLSRMTPLVIAGRAFTSH